MFLKTSAKPFKGLCHTNSCWLLFSTCFLKHLQGHLWACVTQIHVDSYSTKKALHFRYLLQRNLNQNPKYFNPSVSGPGVRSRKKNWMLKLEPVLSEHSIFLIKNGYRLTQQLSVQKLGSLFFICYKMAKPVTSVHNVFSNISTFFFLFWSDWWKNHPKATDWKSNMCGEPCMHVVDRIPRREGGTCGEPCMLWIEYPGERGGCAGSPACCG